MLMFSKYLTVVTLLFGSTSGEQQRVYLLFVGYFFCVLQLFFFPQDELNLTNVLFFILPCDEVTGRVGNSITSEAPCLP